MAKRMRVGLAAGLLLSWTGAGVAAPPDVTKMLSLRPRQEGVAYSIPTPQEQESCKVELIRGKSGGSGWLLKDPRGQPLRYFVDSRGSNKVDILSYFQDGVEVYREIDSNHNGTIDQFRWLNAGGMKFGIDRNEDGKIDLWQQISAEEVSQEALQALITRDFGRLQLLFITEAEIKALGVSAAETQRLAQLQAQAPAKFQAMLGKVAGFSDKTHWVRLEGSLPQCQPAGENGNTKDLIKYGRATVLYENAGKHDFLMLGDLVLVGTTWRLTESPSLGDEVAAAAPADPELQRLLDELRNLDVQGGKIQEGSGPNADAARYNLARADLIGKILLKDKPEQMEQWVRQQAECLSAAAQNSAPADKAAYQRLLQLEQKIVKEAPGSNLAAFVTFREMQADYASKATSTDKDTQAQWLDRLTKFVQAYPKSEDAADAMMHLGMVSEFANKEVEAKNWYAKLATDFPMHPLAAKAQGAVRRLNLDGQVLELTAPQLNGGAFDLAALRGKVVAIYYWASWDQQYVGDFARLKLLADKYGTQGFAVVCVNLDNGPPPANQAVQVPGIQLMQPGGLESPLATQYGIMTLPNLFLVGKDGKVLSHTVQVGTLEEEVKKNLK
jgi:hypothetical protein